MTTLRRTPEGDLDEIVAENASVHIEQLSDRAVFVHITDAAGVETRLTVFGRRLEMRVEG